MLTLWTSLSDSRVVLSSACRAKIVICVFCLSSTSSPVFSETSVKSELKPLMEYLVERLKTAKPEDTLANCAIDDANCRDERRFEVLTSSRFDDCFLCPCFHMLINVFNVDKMCFDVQNKFVLKYNNIGGRISIKTLWLYICTGWKNLMIWEF